MVEGYTFAAGSADITPQEAIPLAGYATLRKPTFERVADRLEANVLVLRSAQGIAVFVAMDLMYVGAFLRDRIIDALSNRVPPENIFLASSHTHFGPPTEDSLPVLGAVTLEYREFVIQRVIDLAFRLLDETPIPASLDYREGEAAQTDESAS